MFHPVGPQQPAIYWRRRFIALASVVALAVLIVLTVHAVRSDGQETPTAGGTGSQTGSVVASPSSSARPTATSKHTSSAPSSAKHSAKTSGKPSPSRSTTAPPPACTAGNLVLTSVVGKTNYRVGDAPLLQLQVVNKGSKPCVQDLADKQVEMRVYNGESRVWGSHDCQVQAGSQLRTLAPRMTVRVAISWSGRTSEPGCKGTRQRVGAGTYTLYTALAGHTGAATQFAVS